MEKTYDPKHIENKWYQTWEQANYFAPSGHGQSYCIVIPPPNVTGSLHMGHAFQYSLMDALIRYQRMCGRNTLWQTGTDHAGIATQIVVEQQLKQKNISRHALGRDEFVTKVWQWKNESGGTICQQQRRLGISVDWQRERFTMDPGLAAAVQHVFIALYEEGLIYRGKRLVNWDPVLNTAISDLEVINEEQDGELWYIKYPIVADAEGAASPSHLTIATTRPETILADVAIAVHPEDERYQQLIGKQVQIPLVERTIPIIADASVLKEFGSGCVKITPAHDFNDYATGQRHALPMINIFTPHATLNDSDAVPTDYRGLDRFVARKKIAAELTEKGFLEKTEPYKISVPKGDRSGVVIEPYLTDQWFVKAKELAEPAIDAVKSGKIKFVPENWSKTYFQWLENIQDWCISRQIWWGHRIPAWYDGAGNVYVGNSEAEVRQKHQLGKDIVLTQDADVLDTWFSSALWPFSTLGWPEQTAEYKTFYPTSVLVTGFDIIFFWVVRMVMMGIKFTGQVPFHDVYITGLIRDSHGQKMSKSKGNIIDPVDLIDGIDLEALVAKRTSNLMQPQLAKAIERATRADFPKGIEPFGTDALRFTFCALASTGRDINFDFGRLEGYRHFCTKLWNAARYVLMQFENGAVGGVVAFSNIDLWIKTKLQQTIKSVAEHFATYRFDLIAQTIYEFVWYEFCDWYLELAKPILTASDGDPALKNGARQTLVEVLEAALRLVHPLMPFISEEIWQQIIPLTKLVRDNSKLATTTANTIMLQPYPTYNEQAVNPEALREVEWLKAIIMAVRNIRGAMNIPPKKLLRLHLSKGTDSDSFYAERNKLYLLNVAKLEALEWHESTATTTFCASTIIEKLELHIPMEGVIDKNSELTRLNKEVLKLKGEHDKLANKLQNPAYHEKAPAEIVNKEQLRFNELENLLDKVQKNLSAVERL
jgi:valyl-tRNA synthetase